MTNLHGQSCHKINELQCKNDGSANNYELNVKMIQGCCMIHSNKYRKVQERLIGFSIGMEWTIGL